MNGLPKMSSHFAASVPPHAYTQAGNIHAVNTIRSQGHELKNLAQYSNQNLEPKGTFTLI